MIYTGTILLLKTPIDKPNLRSYFFDRSQQGTSQPIFFSIYKEKKGSMYKQEITRLQAPKRRKKLLKETREVEHIDLFSLITHARAHTP